MTRTDQLEINAVTGAEGCLLLKASPATRPFTDNNNDSVTFLGDSGLLVHQSDGGILPRLWGDKTEGLKNELRFLESPWKYCWLDYRRSNSCEIRTSKWRSAARSFEDRNKVKNRVNTVHFVAIANRSVSSVLDGLGRNIKGALCDFTHDMYGMVCRD